MGGTIIKYIEYCNGYGVFANKNFKKNEIVFVFKGKIVDYRKVTHRGLQIEKKKWINPNKNNPGYYLNHSCNPNCGIKNSNKITAMKRIKKGEEITIDYSMMMELKNWDMECECQHKDCRKLIKSYKSIPNKLKNKYNGWVSDYLKK